MNVDRVICELVELSGYGVFQWPFTYLGVPLGGNFCAESLWALVV